MEEEFVDNLVMVVPDAKSLGQVTERVTALAACYSSSRRQRFGQPPAVPFVGCSNLDVPGCFTHFIEVTSVTSMKATSQRP